MKRSANVSLTTLIIQMLRDDTAFGFVSMTELSNEFND